MKSLNKTFISLMIIITTQFINNHLRSTFIFSVFLILKPFKKCTFGTVLVLVSTAKPSFSSVYFQYTHKVFHDWPKNSGFYVIRDDEFICRPILQNSIFHRFYVSLRLVDLIYSKVCFPVKYKSTHLLSDYLFFLFSLCPI